MSAALYSTPGIPGLRADFRRGVHAELAAMRGCGWTVTDRWVRFAGWQRVRDELANSIARDVISGREQCRSDLDLYQRICARTSTLAAHERAARESADA